MRFLIACCLAPAVLAMAIAARPPGGQAVRRSGGTLEHGGGVHRRYGLGGFFVFRQPRGQDTEHRSNGGRGNCVRAVLCELAHLFAIPRGHLHRHLPAALEHHFISDDAQSEQTTRHGQLVGSACADSQPEVARELVEKVVAWHRSIK